MPDTPPTVAGATVPRRLARHRTVEEIRDALAIAQDTMGYSVRKIALHSGVSSRSIIQRLTGYYGKPGRPRDSDQLDILRDWLDEIGAFQQLDARRYGVTDAPPVPVAPSVTPAVDPRLDPQAFRARPPAQDATPAEWRHIHAVLAHARAEGYDAGVRDALDAARKAIDTAAADLTPCEDDDTP